MFTSFTLSGIIYIWIAIALILFPIQLFISAPYGRHTKTTWGPMISNKLGWILMEGWALVAFWSVYIVYFSYNSYSLFFAGLYTFHYINRSFIFPLRTNTKGKEMPLMIALSAMLSILWMQVQSAIFYQMWLFIPKTIFFNGIFCSDSRYLYSGFMEITNLMIYWLN